MFSGSCRISDEVKILHLPPAEPGNATESLGKAASSLSSRVGCQRSGRDSLGSCRGVVEVIGGALGVRGRGEDGAGILLQDFQPVGDIGGVFLARFLVQVEVGANKGAAVRVCLPA